MEDDIVCLGTSRPTTSRTDKRHLTAITLHVEKHGSTPANTLTFRRADTTVVLVGRRSASGNPGDDYITVCDKNASFRSAVVSRRHGKIAFSDSGHAYLIDLGSHHGTYVRSLADRVSHALVQETPTLLMDGDIITFGKAVGRGEESVQPIVARVELVYAPVSTNTPDESVTLRSSTPTTLHVSPVSPGQSSTGRYGIHVGSSPFSSSSSSSSDGDGDSMEHDSFSDIEEIPPPNIQAQKPSQNKSESHHGQQAISQSQSQEESSTKATWSTHPVPAIPQMINRVANSLLFHPRTSLPRDHSLWFSEYQTPERDQSQSSSKDTDNRQDKQSSEQDEDYDSRAQEDDRERRLRDTLAQRRAQRQGQGNAPSTAPTSRDTHVPSTDDAPVTDTPVVTNDEGQLVMSGDMPLPIPAPVPVLNRLPSMTALIERPLVQLSQYILGGLGADKTKSVDHNTAAVDGPPKTVECNATGTEAQATEQAPVGRHGPEGSDSVVGAAMPDRPITSPPLTSLLPWEECPRPTTKPAQYGMLPSLAAALSPGHGNEHVHAHSDAPGQNGWVRPWYLAQQPPSEGMFIPAPVPRLLPLLSSSAWNIAPQWWDPYVAPPQAPEASLGGGEPDDPSGIPEIHFVPIAAPAPVPYNYGFGRLPVTNMETAERGPAQSPPPMVRGSASPSPGLSYASSRESSPDMSEDADKQTPSQKEREKSEPMDLSSRSNSSVPEPRLRRAEKGEEHLWHSLKHWFETPDDSQHNDGEEDNDEDDEDEDEDEGEQDMDVEAGSIENDTSSQSSSLPRTRSGRPYQLTFVREQAAAHEAEIRRVQEQDRERERERAKEWLSVVEKREAQRRDTERATELHYLRETVSHLQSDLNSLRIQANAQYTSHSDQLASFDGRIREVDAECGVLCVRVESLGERLEVAQIDVASVNAALDNILSNEEANESGGGNREDDAMDEGKADEADMKALIADMKALRASTQLQVDEELRALRTLRSEAEAAYADLTQRMHVKAEEAQVQTQPPVLPSLKRKRDDSDEDKAAPNGDDKRSHEGLPEHAKDANELESDSGKTLKNAISLAFATSEPVIASASASGAGSALPDFLPAVEHATLALRDDRPPPRKRARKIVRFVARTATAVGVGAVVTWTALAFS